MSRERAHASAMTSGPRRRPDETRINIPEGTVVELEAACTINPCELKDGDAVSFRVAVPLIIDSVVLIAAGSAAIGIVTEAAESRGQRADIIWSVIEMTAPNGVAFPVRLSFSLTCGYAEPDECEVKAAALMFPVSPLALSYGFRREECTRVPAGARFRAVIRGDLLARISRDKEEV